MEIAIALFCAMDDRFKSAWRLLYTALATGIAGSIFLHIYHVGPYNIN